MAEPPNEPQLHRGRGRSAEPRSVENIETGGERVRHCAYEIVRTGNESEKTGMIDMQIVGQDFALELGEELAWIASVFRRFKIEQREDARRVGFCSDWAARHMGEVIREKIDNSVAELPHFFERQRYA